MQMTNLFQTKWARWLALLCALVALAVVASPVGANAPIFVTLDLTDLITVTSDLCPFEVEISSDFNGTARIFTDNDGNPTHLNLNVVEQDTFSANGHTLEGLPFHNVQVGLYDEAGELVYHYEVGVIERVPLPDGTAFLSAGRLDFVANGSSIEFTPDVGHAGDIDALCAALAP